MHAIMLRSNRTSAAGPKKGFSRSIVRALVSSRTWAELAYVVTDPIASAVGFGLVAAVCGLAPIFIVAMAGLPITAGLGLVRPLATAERARARALLNMRLPPMPPRPARERGYFGWVRPAVADATGWRAVVFLVLHLPYAVAAFGVAVVFWGGAAGGLISPLWLALGGGRAFSASTAPLFAAGLILLFAAPWAVRSTVSGSRLLLRLTLDPNAGRQRVRDLELARGEAIENSAAMLRQIERDLHDGAQARLVAMTMRLSVVREQLASAKGPGADAARELLDAVHRDATQAMADLRNLARGIRPRALDDGLEAAIDSLAAHSPMPVDLQVSMTERPSPGIETIAYFCAAELLANVCEHSHASYACIEVIQRGGHLLLQVTDDGVGGARAEAGSGLDGLAARVRSVDGTLSVHSPPGGPTLVTVVIPIRV
jgi:signal transduction histidine kinase